MLNIRTGVINANNIHGDAFYNSINLSYEQAVLDGCGEDEWDSMAGGDSLIGFIQCSVDDPDAYISISSDSGDTEAVFKPDPKASFSAIVSNNANVAQVVSSKYVKGCGYCSPCYPGQGDLDTVGGVFSYAVPPDDLCEEYETSGIIPLDDYEKTV